MLKFQPIGFDQLTLDTPQGTLAYSVSTASKTLDPPIVFLHSLGGGSSAYEWSKVFPAFATTHRAIAPDLIGWGDSDHPAKTYHPQDYLDQIQILLEQVAQTPAWVVASSLTAALCIRLAIHKPSLFRGLFLVSPSGYRDFGQGYERELAAQLIRTPGLDRLIYGLGAANEWAVRNFLVQFLFAQPSRLCEETIAAYLASSTKPNAEYAALASLRGDICFDLAEYIPHLQVPTVFVWGRQSRFKSPEQGKQLARLNPEYIRAFYIISNSGVLPHLETPATVIGLLLQFVLQGAF